MAGHRILNIIPGVVLVMALAAGLTSLPWVAKLRSRPTAVATHSAQPPAISPSPQATPSVAPLTKQATTTSPVNLRSAKSTSTSVLAEVKAGESVTLGAQQDDLWQEVTYNGTHGYVARSYLQYK